MLAAVASAQDPTAKLDPGLAEATAPMPVFVYMHDQLFARGGDYPAFCAAPEHQKRSALRGSVSAQLRQKSDDSFAALHELVEEQQQSGGIASLRRFWIVNGFSCDASAAACRALAARPEVARVFHQRGQLVQHRDETRGEAWLRRGEQSLERALALWKEEPPFEGEGVRTTANLQRLGVGRAWAAGVRGEGVVIAMCESGLLVAPQFVEALWRNPREQVDGKDDDGNGLIDDVFGYDFAGDTPFAVGDTGRSSGTMCASVMVARPRGEPPVGTGIAPRAKLMVLRDGGSLRALEYAVAQGADVFHCSYRFGARDLGPCVSIYRTAFEHMAACGVLAVGGSVVPGDERADGCELMMPIDIPCVISTAGLDRTGMQQGAAVRDCSWREYPPFAGDPPLKKPDVCGLFGGFPVWQYAALGQRHAGQDPVDLMMGPGFDALPAAHAAAVAALVLCADPELPPWRVKELLAATALTPPPEETARYGAGLVQAAAAVKAAKER